MAVTASTRTEIQRLLFEKPPFLGWPVPAGWQIAGRESEPPVAHLEGYRIGGAQHFRLPVNLRQLPLKVVPRGLELAAVEVAVIRMGVARQAAGSGSLIR